MLALGAAPVYLIARDKFRTPWMGLVFAVVYLMYAPLQWISWAMFHPEALVITPFLFAWWFATRERWGWFFAMVLIALATREDTAMAVFMMGVVLLIYMRKAPDYRRVVKMSVGVMALGAVWYLVATKIVLPAFNDGKEPFYITYFYGNYGKSAPEIIGNIVTPPGQGGERRGAARPPAVLQAAVVAGRVDLAGESTRAAHGGAADARQRHRPQPVRADDPLPVHVGDDRADLHRVHSGCVRVLAVQARQGAAAAVAARLQLCLQRCVVAVAAQPRRVHRTGASRNPRHDSLREALTYIPDDAAVSASYQILPHLSHRRHIYDWPNPFWAAVWGNDDCAHLPDPTTIDYVILDKTQIGANNQALYDHMIEVGGPFEPVFEDDNVVVLKRVGTSPEVDVQPQQDSCQRLALQHDLRALG